MKNLELSMRYLRPDDELLLSTFFKNLSRKTKKWYNPHPLTSAEAKHLCNKNGGMQKEIIVVNNDEIIGYCVLHFGFRYWDKHRYQDQFDEDNRVCLVAPCVADKYQHMGVGSAMMNHVANVVSLADRDVIILWGGVVKSNQRAINFYEKLGFKTAREWFHPTKHVDCYDMYWDIREPLEYLFLDMDGTLRETIPDPTPNNPNDRRPPIRVEEIKIIPGVANKLKEWERKGWFLVGVSNQSGVEKGYITEEGVEHVAAETMRQLDIYFPFYYAPCKKEGTPEQLNLRKPNTGMAEQAFEDWGPLDLDNSYMVGDYINDEKFADNLGIKYIDINDFLKEKI